MFDKFIKASNEYTTDKKAIPAPYIRKSFDIDFVPKEAKLYICTAGFYELYINGKNITKGALAPYISNPDHLVCYDEYDISSLLVKGKNAVGVILGNGFANQTTKLWFFNECSFRAPLAVSINLTAEAEEQTYTLESDESFKVHDSHIIYDIYRDGTHHDARLEIDGWCEADFDDSAWNNAMLAPAPKGEIIPCTAHPIRVREELSPISIEKQENFCYYKDAFPNGNDIKCTHVECGYLYDFGINTSGVCRLKIKGERGQRVTIRHCERLANGKFNINTTYFNPLHLESKGMDCELFTPLFQSDVYILKGGEEEIFIPPFTYHGFRYAFVEGITEEQATADLLTYEVFSSDVRRRANFDCYDEILNKIYAMTVNADLSNFHYFLTDCPHREKNGWTGDASVSAEQLHLTFDCSESLRLWMRSMRHTQREDGMLPGVVPTEKYGYTWGNGPMWDSAAVNIPYAAYKYDGRLDIFKENAAMIDKYLHYIAGRRDERGLIAVGLGDWCQPRHKSPNFSSPLVLTDSAITYDNATKAALMFEKAEFTAEANYARTLAAEIKASIRRELIDYEYMSAKGDCQTSQALLIALGIFEPEEYGAAYARLIEIINQDGKRLDTGMIGLRYIFDVLVRGGDTELALYMIKRDDEPSYGATIKRGATALCEELEDGTTNASENHHFFGDIIRVFTNYLAGLTVNPSLENPKEILFSPVTVDSLDFADAEYESVKVGWRREGGKITAYADVCGEYFGFFVYGDKKIPLQKGHNEFTL